MTFLKGMRTSFNSRQKEKKWEDGFIILHARVIIDKMKTEKLIKNRNEFIKCSNLKVN